MKVTIKNLKAVKWQDIVVFKNGIYYATIGKDPSFYRDGKHMFFHIGTTEASTAVEIFNIAKIYPDCGCSFHEIGYDDGFYAEEIFEKYKGFEMFDANKLKKP